MKHSKLIVLSAALLSAVGCGSNASPEGQWIEGDDSRDTISNGRHYRYYGGYYYPIFAGRINPGIYRGATRTSISDPNFKPTKVNRGGFGRRTGSGS